MSQAFTNSLPDAPLHRYQSLLRIAEALATHRDLTSLFHNLGQHLRLVINFDWAGALLYEPKDDRLRLHLLASPDLADTGPITGSAVDDLPSAWVWKNQQPLIVQDATVETRFPQISEWVRKNGVKSYCSLPLTFSGRQLGALGFASVKTAAWSEADLEFLLQVAGLVAITVNNAINSENVQASETARTLERDRLRLMLEVNNAVVTQLDLGELVRVISSSLCEALHFDLVGLSLYDPDANCLRAYYYDVPATMPPIEPGTAIPLENSIGGLAFTSGQSVFINRPDPTVSISAFNQRFVDSGITAGGCVPLIVHGRKLGVLGVGCFREDAFPETHQQLLNQIADQIAIAVDNALNFERARKAEQEIKRQLERERLMLEINNAVVSQLSLRELARVTAACLRDVLHHDITGISLYDQATNQFRAYMFDLPDSLPPIPEGTPMPLEGTVGGMAFLSGQPIFMSRPDPNLQVAEFDRRLIEKGIQSGGVIPLIAHGRKLGFLGVGSFREEAFSAADQELVCHIANQIAIAAENALNYQQIKQDRDRFEMLLEVSNAVSASLDLRELLHATSAILRKYKHHDVAVISLYEAERDMFRVLALDNPPAFVEEGQLLPLEGLPEGLAFKTRKAVWRDHLDLTEFPAPGIRQAYEAGLRSGCAVPLIARDRVMGVLSVASFREASVTEADVETLQLIAHQIASAIENAWNFERARAAERQAKQQSERLQLLLQVNNAIASALDLPSLFRTVSACLRQVFRHDYAVMGLYNDQEDVLRVHALDRGEELNILQEGQIAEMENTPVGLAIRLKQAVVTGPDYLKEFPAEVVRRAVSQGIRANCSVPLLRKNRVIGAMSIASKTECAFTKDDGELFMQIAGQVAIAVENALAYGEIETLKNKLASEKLYLEDEIRTEHNFEELIGESRTFKRILKQIETVAPTDAAVLIRGETGTGKELIARAIHNLSNRRERTLVKLNCAAIPTGLLESELFGHEKGAFTGAITQRIGRFELAHKGTLLLDEIGDIPLELQPKLLRVLQEQEFERLGSTRTQRVDVRLIAATNCDLEQMVAEKKYRSDLFYRLNVFPVFLPPLRERAEDIPALVRFFTQKYARRMKKRIEAIPVEAMDALTAYPWPGNVRELEHFMERAVVLTQGAELEVSQAELKHAVPPVSRTNISTLETAEREHILRALEETRWVIGGAQGAAARLGMKRTTLQSRMQKLGITRQS